MFKFSTETRPQDNPSPNCPFCNHSAKYHIIVASMGMTVCRVAKCKCALTFGYTEKVLEEMK